MIMGLGSVKLLELLCKPSEHISEFQSGLKKKKKKE